MANKDFVVKHTVLGITNPETGEDYKQGETVRAEHLGDKANFDRLVNIGAIGEAEDKREEVPGSPSEAEALAVEQSQIVDLDPAASPLADQQDTTDQQLNKDQNKANKGK